MGQNACDGGESGEDKGVRSWADQAAGRCSAVGVHERRTYSTDGNTLHGSDTAASSIRLQISRTSDYWLPFLIRAAQLLRYLPVSAFGTSQGKSVKTKRLQPQPQTRNPGGVGGVSEVQPVFRLQISRTSDYWLQFLIRAAQSLRLLPPITPLVIQREKTSNVMLTASAARRSPGRWRRVCVRSAT